MTKKHFIALADAVIEHNRTCPDKFTHDQLATLADFCRYENRLFDRSRWMGYIAERSQFGLSPKGLKTGSSGLGQNKVTCSSPLFTEG